MPCLMPRHTPHSADAAAATRRDVIRSLLMLLLMPTPSIIAVAARHTTPLLRDTLMLLAIATRYAADITLCLRHDAARSAIARTLLDER